MNTPSAANRRLILAYAEASRDLALPLARALEAAGFEVDPVTTQLTEADIAAARTVLVCWTPAAAASDTVTLIAARARKAGKLASVLLAPCTPPGSLGGRSLLADLSGWHGDASDRDFIVLVQAIHARQANRFLAAPIWRSRYLSWGSAGAATLAAIAIVANLGDLTQTIDGLANPSATQRDVDALRADVERAVNLIKQQSPQAFNADTEAALRESIERLLTSQSGARGEAARALESGDIDSAVAQLQSAADEGERAAEGLAQTWAEIGALRFGTDTFGAMSAYARAAQLAPAYTEYRVMLGNLQIRVGHLDDAYTTFTAISQEADTNSMSALAYGNLGVIAKMRADSANARDHFEIALELNRADGNKTGEAADLGDLGDLALSEKRFTDAKKLYEQSLALYTEMGDPEGQITTTIRLAAVAHDRGRLDEAERLYASALSRAQMHQDQIGIAGAQSGLGDVALARKQLAAAKTSYEAGLAAAVSISAREDEAYALGGLGEVAEAQGDKVLAINHLREAMWIYNDIGNVAEAQLIMDKMKKLGAVPHPDGPEN